MKWLNLDAGTDLKSSGGAAAQTHLSTLVANLQPQRLWMHAEGDSVMSDNRNLLALHRRKLQDLHQRARKAIEALSDQDANWRPNEESNSIANLVLHMAGNLQQRIVSGIGGAPDHRDRDAEFENRDAFSTSAVLDILDESFHHADTLLAHLDPDRLSEPQRIRSHEVTLLEALFAVATHMSEHVGQILYIAKLRLGPGYEILSIPRTRRFAVPRERLVKRSYGHPTNVLCLHRL